MSPAVWCRRWAVALALAAGFLAASAAGAGVSELAAEVTAGEMDYEVIVTIANRDRENAVRGVVISAASPPTYLSGLRFEPSRIEEVAPGVSREVTLRFGVDENAPDGAEERLELDVAAAQGLLAPGRLRLLLTIRAGSDDEGPAVAGDGDDSDGEGPDRAFFVIKVEGTGFTPHWAGASHVMAGAHERIIVLQRDRDLRARLLELLAGYDRDICEITNPRGFIRTNESPQIWNAGPQITVTDGPFETEYEARSEADLNTWSSSSSKGPGLGKLKKAAGCG